jgi:hypothetical protein
LRSRLSPWKEQRRAASLFNQTTTLDERLEEQAERLRKEAEGKPPFN